MCHIIYVTNYLLSIYKMNIFNSDRRIWNQQNIVLLDQNDARKILDLYYS